MIKCKIIQKKLALFLYHELDELSTAELQAHVSLCKKCQRELLELQRLYQEIPREPYFKLNDSAMTHYRTLAFSQLKRHTARRNRFNAFFPRPARQFAFALVLLCVGFLLGRHNLFTDQTQNNVYRLLAADQIIRTDHSYIQPSLLSVEDVEIDEARKTIDIRYNTHNYIQLRGSVYQPEIQEILCFAVLEDENPAVRLHAIKALKFITQGEKSTNPQIVSAIAQLLLKEKNAGIQLMALRTLKSMPPDEQIQNIFIDELLYNKNTAIRIAAFEGLVVQGGAKPQILPILKSVKSDSSGYFQFKTEQILKNLSKQTTQKREELL